MPTEFARSFKIDGSYPNNVTFSAKPSSDFVYAPIRVSDGVHFPMLIRGSKF